MLGCLEAGKPGTTEFDNVALREQAVLVRTQFDHGARDLPSLLVGYGDNHHAYYGRVREQHLLDLNRAHVLATC